ncbi:MAG: cytoplasmic protein [Desulfobacca sp.]|nr:cytoplasmic protein [Desulfobacca sp.]
MDRRTFLKEVAQWTAGLTLTPPLFRFIPELGAQTRPSIVSVTEGTDYGVLVSKVLQPLGGLQSFVKKGQRVVVKPNIGWDRTPDQGANTHPEVVKALVRLALDAGASQVLVFDRTCNEERRCYQNSGIKRAVESLGDRRVLCSYIDNRKFVPIRLAKGKSISEWEFYKEALEADCYINVPVAKHHASAGLSLGLKNIMGVIGGFRGKIHFSLGQRIADLNTVLKTHLTVIDATRILLRNGPQGGDLKDVKILNTLMASTDIVAVDAYATTLFGMKPEEIESTQAAHQLGLGEMDLKKIKIVRA